MLLVVSHMPDRSRVMTDKKGYAGTQGWRLGVRLITPPRKKNNVMKPQGNELDGYLRKDMKQHMKVCGKSHRTNQN